MKNKQRNKLASVILTSALALVGCGKEKPQLTDPINTQEHRRILLEGMIGRSIERVVSFQSTRGSRTFEFIDKKGDYGFYYEDISAGKREDLLLKGFYVKLLNDDSSVPKYTFPPAYLFHRVFLAGNNRYIHRMGDLFYLTNPEGKILQTGEKLKN